MTLRSFAFVLIAVSLLAVGSFAAACGGDDEALSTQQYFARLDDLEAQFETDLQAAEAANDGEDALKVRQENLVNALALYVGFVDGISDLAPPEEIKSQHEELVRAMRALADAFSEYSDEISNVASIEELEAITGGEELRAAQTRSEQACLVIEQLAADNGVEIDLNCRDRD